MKDYFAIKLKNNKIIIVYDSFVLTKVLDKAGDNFDRIRKLTRAVRSNTAVFFLYVRPQQKAKFKARAKDLGFNSLNKYIKTLISLDCEYNILQTGEDFLGTSKYQLTGK